MRDPLATSNGDSSQGCWLSMDQRPYLPSPQPACPLGVGVGLRATTEIWEICEAQHSGTWRSGACSPTGPVPLSKGLSLPEPGFENAHCDWTHRGARVPVAWADHVEGTRGRIRNHPAWGSLFLFTGRASAYHIHSTVLRVTRGSTTEPCPQTLINC